LVLLGVQRGRGVVVSIDVFGISNPILYQGAIPVFIDSELQTWNLYLCSRNKPLMSEIAKGKKTKSHYRLHFVWGSVSTDGTHSSRLNPNLEDSAEALGAHTKQKCGTFGDIG
jgi:hypothetical protein